MADAKVAAAIPGADHLRRRSGRRVEALLRVARTAGVLNVIRPYVEALV